MKESKYRMEFIAVIIFSFFMMLYGAFTNDRIVLLFFQMFPLMFGIPLMWKEGRLWE